MIRNAAVFLLIAAAACSGKQPQDDVANGNSGVNQQTGSPLASSVEVEVRGDTVRVGLHVTNPTDRPVALEFTSGQRYDFAIRSAAGADLWRWSADKSFMQALGTETLAPGASLRYTESWTSGGQRGAFVAIAELTSTSHPIQESAQFEIR
jgi:hypothetical protein